MPLQKTYTIEKVYHLSKTDHRKLDILILHNMNRYDAYNDLFPNKINCANINKQKYFSTVFSKNEAEAWEYIDKIYTRKFKDLYLTREKIILEIYDDIKKARNKGDLKSVMTGYTLIAKMSGYLIERHQIQVEKDVEIQYILPDTNNYDNNIKIEAVEINDQI